MTLNLQAIAFLLGAGLIIVAIVGGGVEVRDLRVPPMAAIPRTLAAVFGGLLMLGATPLGPALLGNIWAISATNSVQTIRQNAVTNVASAGNAAAPAPTPAATIPANAAAVPANVAESATAAAVAVPARPVQAGGDAEQPAVPQTAPADPTDREITVSDLLGKNQKYERVGIRVNGKSVGTLSIDASNPSDSVSFRVRGNDTYELSGNDAVYIDGQPVGRSITGSGTFSSDIDRRRYRLWQVFFDPPLLTLELRAD